MDILKIIEESGSELYPEDLDFFETELATGDYSKDYILQARSKIAEVRKWLLSDNTESNAECKHAEPAKGVVLGLGEIAPKEQNPTAQTMTDEQLILSEIEAMRRDDSYKSRFKKYIAENEKINCEFLDRNFSFFEEWEMEAIVSVMQLSEDFIEKYFDVLNSEKIARYQRFSEAFFMKHFAKLDAKTVLEQGKNEWRKKDKRSNKLDVYLRLKGVKI